MQERLLETYRTKRQEAEAGGGEKRIAAQHAKGKLTARERIAALVDPDSFIEQQPFVTVRSTDFGMDRQRVPGDGVVTGSAKIEGRQVFVAAQDFTVVGGTLGEMHATRIAHAQRLALESGVPFIQINDSGGARIQEGCCRWTATPRSSAPTPCPRA